MPSLLRTVKNYFMWRPSREEDDDDDARDKAGREHTRCGKCVHDGHVRCTHAASSSSAAASRGRRAGRSNGTHGLTAAATSVVSTSACAFADASSSGDDADAWDVTLSFSCGGWFHVYFLGVAHALVQSGVLQRWHDEGRRVRFCGSSVGALVATCLACGQYDFLAVLESAVQAAMRFRSSWLYAFSLRRYLEHTIATYGAPLRQLDSPDAATAAAMRARVGGGRLEVSVTTLPRLRAKLLRDFDAYWQVHEALMASCCIVPLINMPFKMRRTGEWVVDGAVANFTPRIADPHCISISPMYFQDASVRPHLFMPSWWAVWPPDEARYRNLFWIGYNDMIDFLVRDGHVAHDAGEQLLRPEADFRSLETYWDLAFTICMEGTMLIWVRPVVAVCIYVELLLSFALHCTRRVTASVLPGLAALLRLSWHVLTLQILRDAFACHPDARDGAVTMRHTPTATSKTSCTAATG